MFSVQTTDSIDFKTAAIAAVVGMVILLAMYPDRCVGTRSRKDILTLKPSYPLIGNLPWLLKILFQRERLLTSVYKIQTEQAPNGMPFTLTVPALGGRITVVNNPIYIDHVQKGNFDNYEKGPDQRRIMSDVLQSGIFASDGHVWLQQRKLAAVIFSKNNFQTHVQETVVREIKILDTLLQDASRKGTKVNLPDLAFRFTLDSFGSMAFGADINSMPKQVEGLKIENEFAAAFDAAQEHMNHRIFALLPQWTEVFTSEGRQHQKNIKTLRTYCFRIIDSRLEKREKQGGVETASTDKSGKDLLELFMDRGLDREELMPIILNFLIAGRDTTAQTLAWLMTELCKSPQYIPKIRDAIVPVLGEPNEQRPMQYDDIKEMPFLQSCFYEATRLHPAVPQNIKRALKDDVIPGKGKLPDLVIKGGESVMWSDWTMSRLPEVWEDATTFKPERFMEDGRCKEMSMSVFHSFNHGPRACLGKTLAVYEGMAVMSAILGRYDITFDDQEMKNVTFGDSLTLPCSGYNVKLKLRKEVAG